MTDSPCPRCGQPLTTGLAEPLERSGQGPSSPAPLLCVACGWSSASDVPGSEGGDNGGA